MQPIQWLGELAVDAFISSPFCADRAELTTLVGWLVSAVSIFALLALIAYLRGATSNTFSRSICKTDHSWVKRAKVSEVYTEHAFVFEHIECDMQLQPFAVWTTHFSTWALVLEQMGFDVKNLAKCRQVFLDDKPLSLASKPKPGQRIFIARPLTLWERMFD